ncbi:helix-turn-helix domain-containing protein [Xylophilus rhododendri]|uniref:helix-turn-helix domain-containing protein n=1 Tax=Xylophilus rhododendri TaxID=2697032 RepID=UPI002DDC022F|nr:LysR family transcriptional regulator [Xylophilus rhododendri]
MDKFLEMKTFAAVVDGGSFVKAADTLGLSKAAVSRHVGELEARLGVRLLHRTPASSRSPRRAMSSMCAARSCWPAWKRPRPRSAPAAARPAAGCG